MNSLQVYLLLSRFDRFVNANILPILDKASFRLSGYYPDRSYQRDKCFYYQCESKRILNPRLYALGQRAYYDLMQPDLKHLPF